MNLSSDVGGRSAYQQIETCKPTLYFLEDRRNVKVLVSEGRSQKLQAT